MSLNEHSGFSVENDTAPQTKTAPISMPHVGNDPINLSDPTGLMGCCTIAPRPAFADAMRDIEAASIRFEARRSRIEAVQNMVSDNGDTLLLVAPATMAIQAPISGAIATNSARTVTTATGSTRLGAFAGELMSTVSEIALTSAGAGILSVNQSPTPPRQDISQIINSDPLEDTTRRTIQPDPIASNPNATSRSRNPQSRTGRIFEGFREIIRFIEDIEF